MEYSTKNKTWIWFKDTFYFLLWQLSIKSFLGNVFYFFQSTYPSQITFEDDFPFPKVGYFSSLLGPYSTKNQQTPVLGDFLPAARTNKINAPKGPKSQQRPQHRAHRCWRNCAFVETTMLKQKNDGFPCPYHPCMAYLPTFGDFFYGKSRETYHT